MILKLMTRSKNHQMKWILGELGGEKQFIEIDPKFKMKKRL